MPDKERETVAFDLGSRSVKIGILKGSGEPEFYAYDTALFYAEFGRATEEGFSPSREKLGVSESARMLATGYGRNALNIAGAEVVPEIQAHAAGAVYQTGLEDFTLVDLGGQDSKIIRVRGGRVVDFHMNERCAASAGRYLENMASILGYSLSELSEFVENPAKLSATCAVFGESELVAKLAMGVPREKLAAGVNRQIVERFGSRLDANPPGKLVLAGGVAKNDAVAKLLSSRYSVNVLIPRFPQYNGVIGLIRGNF